MENGKILLSAVVDEAGDFASEVGAFDNPVDKTVSSRIFEPL